MTDTSTRTKEETAAHYRDLLTQAGLPVASVTVPLTVEDIDGLEVCNVEVGDRHECFELGPFAGGRYLRVRSVDNVLLAEVLRRLADDLATETFDERDAKARAEMVECPGCRTRIAPDDVSCGARSCDRVAALEAAL